MREFFKPLRRKIGVMTLVMACVFTVLWVRSLMTEDVIQFDTSSSEDSWVSGNGALIFHGYGEFNPRIKRWHFQWRNQQLYSEIDVATRSTGQTPLAWKYFGFYLWRQHDSKYTEVEIRWEIGQIAADRAAAI